LQRLLLRFRLILHLQQNTPGEKTRLVTQRVALGEGKKGQRLLFAPFNVARTFPDAFSYQQLKTDASNNRLSRQNKIQVKSLYNAKQTTHQHARESIIRDSTTKPVVFSSQLKT